MIEILTGCIQFPNSTTLLEEVNLPPKVVRSVIGRTVTIEILPQEKAMSRRVDVKNVGPDDSPFLIDDDGACWIDYRPVRVRFTYQDGRVWRVPRSWADRVPDGSSNLRLPVSNDFVLTETLNLPTEWDLTDINIPPIIAGRIGGQVVSVEVRPYAGGLVKVLWRDPDGKVWRIPHAWRRRRIMLPDREKLVSQGIPDDVAAEYPHKIVSVNYHPGSLCCLPEHFRFRDGRGGKWPVRIADCNVVGFGNEPEVSPIP